MYSWAEAGRTGMGEEIGKSWSWRSERGSNCTNIRGTQVFPLAKLLTLRLSHIEHMFINMSELPLMTLISAMLHPTPAPPAPFERTHNSPGRQLPGGLGSFLCGIVPPCPPWHPLFQAGSCLSWRIHVGSLREACTPSRLAWFRAAARHSYPHLCTQLTS